MDIYEKMKELGVELPAAPAKGGLYSSCKKFGGNLFYVSGCGPVIDGPVTGRLGKEVTVEQGQVYARACMLNVLAALEKAVGDLRRVKSAVKITTFVQSADDFHEQPRSGQRRHSASAGALGRGSGSAVAFRHRRERAAGQHPRGNGSAV